jgi:release factor glutamine methyltransferase
MSQGWSRLLAEAVTELAQAGVDSPRVDAELLAAQLAGVTRGRLILAADPHPSTVQRFRELVALRATRRPLQHILGTAAFWRAELHVGPGVFVPRPETELLVEWALRRLAGVDKPVVADLCAGSGAIGHAVAGERPDAAVYAVERYPQALEWLHRNLAGTSVTIVEGDATDPAVLCDLDGECDAVVSNPPYIPHRTTVSPEAAADPHTALFGGDDGLSVIRPLLNRAAVLLRPGGVLAIEHDDTHGDILPRLLSEAGFAEAAGHTDLAGRPRFATAVRR